MFFDNLFVRIICYIFFILLPLWFILFFVGYIYTKKNNKFFYLMPLSIVFIWIGLLNFYHKIHTVYYLFLPVEPQGYVITLRNPFILIPFVSLLLTIVALLKNKNWVFCRRFLFLPFVMILLWIFLFLYY